MLHIDEVDASLITTSIPFPQHKNDKFRQRIVVSGEKISVKRKNTTIAKQLLRSAASVDAKYKQINCFVVAIEK